MNEINQQNFCDWIDMEQLLDYTDIIKFNMCILEKYDHMDNDSFEKIINKMINGYGSLTKTSGYCLFYADIEKIDKIWKESKKYIPRKFEEHNNQLSQLKYLKARKDLFELDVLIPPILIVKNDVEFMNRSAYFTNLRDLGQKYIPIVSYMDCAKDFHKIAYDGIKH